MKKFLPMVLLFVLLIFNVSHAQTPEIDVFEWGFNIDGTTYCLTETNCNFITQENLPASMDVTNFDFMSGLGTIEITFSTPGNHTFISWLDLDIDFLTNDSDNETGAAGNLPAASGQTWEIDEPGLGSLDNCDSEPPQSYTGDIFDNFLTSDAVNGSSLDNQIFFDKNVPCTLIDPIDEVSFAMGWDFVLAAGETATITLMVSETKPPGFHIVHSDPDSPADVYMSGFIDIVATLNNAPSIPQLVAPVDGQTGMDTTVQFRWEESTDPDGDNVTYSLHYCENENFIDCTPIQIAFIEKKAPYFAGTGIEFLLFGIVFAGSVRGRRKIMLLLGIVILSAFFLISCGGGGSDNNTPPNNEITQSVSGLNSGTTYFWKVVADDGNGGIVESEVKSFTTQ